MFRGMPMRIRPILPVLLLFSCHLGCEEFTDEFFEMDLSELLAVTVSAPGKIAQSQSMSPAVVQVITREDIRNFGATTYWQ